MFVILKPLRLALKALLAQTTPRELALGLSMGVLIGLVPKGNLLAVVLGIIAAALRLNLGLAVATALAVTFVSPWLDPVSHSVGRYLLTHPALQGFWTSVYNTRLMPWTDFNNTVVLGSFVIGLALFVPVYFATRPVCRRYSETAAKWASRYRLTRLLLGAEWADRFGAVS